MKSTRRHELQDNSLAKRLTTFPEMAKIYGRRAAVVVIFLAIIAFLIYRRYQGTEEQQTARRQNLADAWVLVTHLRNARAIPGDAVRFRTYLQDIIDHSADPAQVANALACLGNLDWALATYPPRPEAATQPAYAPDKSPAELYKDARDAFAQILTHYRDQLTPAIDARFSLAAMAETDGDFDLAHDQYQALLAMTDIPLAQRVIAQARLDGLKEIRIRPIIAPPQGLVAPAIGDLLTGGAPATSASGAIYGPVPSVRTAPAAPTTHNVILVPDSDTSIYGGAPMLGAGSPSGPAPASEPSQDWRLLLGGPTTKPAH